MSLYTDARQHKTCGLRLPPFEIHSVKQPSSHLPNLVQWTSPEGEKEK